MQLRRALAAAALAALALGLALGAPTPADAQQAPRAAGPLVKGGSPTPVGPGTFALKRSGSWALGMRRLENGVAACFAGVANPGQQVFEYMSYNIGLSMFRFITPQFNDMPQQAEIGVVARVDDGKNRGMRGRVINGAATFPVDDASEEKREFIRALAEGGTLYMLDVKGKEVGSFSLKGAKTILTAFGPCKLRLPPGPSKDSLAPTQ